MEFSVLRAAGGDGGLGRADTRCSSSSQDICSSLAAGDHQRGEHPPELRVGERPADLDQGDERLVISILRRGIWSAAAWLP